MRRTITYHRYLPALLGLLALLGLSACGQKGPLYLPDDTDQSQLQPDRH